MWEVMNTMTTRQAFETEAKKHGIKELAPAGSELPTNSADQAEVTSQGQIPAWHDAPTVPGNWISDDFEGISTFNSDDTQAFKTNTGVRWYGPIPPDGDKP